MSSSRTWTTFSGRPGRQQCSTDVYHTHTIPGGMDCCNPTRRVRGTHTSWSQLSGCLHRAQCNSEDSNDPHTCHSIACRSWYTGSTSKLSATGQQSAKKKWQELTRLSGSAEAVMFNWAVLVMAAVSMMCRSYDGGRWYDGPFL